MTTLKSGDLSKTFVREWENSNGLTLKIHQLEIGDVGCVVWDAALVLSAYLNTNSFRQFLKSADLECREDITMVELGSGTGIVGIQAATLDKRYKVRITDLPDLVPLMNKNVATNQSLLVGSLVAEPLSWGSDKSGQKYDVVLMADCIYYEESLSPLVETLLEASHMTSLILCCYEARTEGKNPQTEQKFFQLVEQHFIIEEIPTCDHDPEYRSPDIHILKFTRKT